MDVPVILPNQLLVGKMNDENGDDETDDDEYQQNRDTSSCTYTLIAPAPLAEEPFVAVVTGWNSELGQIGACRRRQV